MIEPLELENVLEQVWNEVSDGATKRKHAFHTTVLANVVNGLPYARNVVLRVCDRKIRTIGFNCDSRSEKLTQFRENPAASWVFYDPAARLQIRMAGKMTVHQGDEVAKRAWDETRIFSRKCYLVDRAPGLKVEEPESGLAEHLQFADPSWEESEAGWENFSVLRCEIGQIDWLWLNSKGHRRANFRWTGDRFEGIWIIP